MGAGSNCRRCVEILNVYDMAGGDDQIFISIQVYIEEYRLPGPIGRRHSAQVCNLFEGAIAPGAREGIVDHLGTAVDPAGIEHEGRVGNLTKAKPVIAAEHIDDQKIKISVAIYIREIDAH